jgi:hypothetical protein
VCMKNGTFPIHASDWTLNVFFPFLPVQCVRLIKTFGAPALVWRPCYSLDRYYSHLYSGIRKLDSFKLQLRLHLFAVPPSTPSAGVAAPDER